MIDFPIEYFDDEVREGFYLPPIMKHCWAAQMEVIKAVDDVCSKHDIKYFIFSGTLMGAVRHGGYIPWDDDVDICMLRRDYDKFLKVAKSSLPDRYYIRNVYTDPTYRQCFTRLSNDDSLGFNDEFWKKGHGFLCTAGIDVFPLDYIPADRDKLNEKVYDTKFLFTLAANYDEFGLNDEVKWQISVVEKKYNINLVKDDTLPQQMFILMDEEFRKTRRYESKKVHIPMLWMEHPTVGIPIEDFDKAVDIAFENTTFKAPYLYDDVLKSMYKSYMKPVRVCDIHGYPWYKPILDEMQGMFYEPDYRFDKSVLPMSNRRETWVNNLMSEMNESAQLFAKASSLAEQAYDSGDADTGNVLMEKCNQLVAKVEGIESKLKGNGRERVVFFTWKSEYWNYLEPFYLNEIASGSEVYVIPLPFVRMTELRKISEQFIETEGFPEYVELTDYREFDYEDVRISRIYFQNQYDNLNGAMRLDERFYASAIRELTDELIYVPWFELDEYGEDDERALYMMKYYLFMPGIVACDRIYFWQEWFKKICVNELTKWAGEDTRDIWENKICVVSFEEDEADDREEDSPVETDESIVGVGSDVKKKMFYYIGTGQMLANPLQMLDKMRNNLSIFDASADKLTVQLYIEYGLLDSLKQCAPKCVAMFDKLCDEYASKGWCEYIKADEPINVNNHAMIDNIINGADAFYGDAGVLMHLFSRAKKPVMLQNIMI